MPGFNKKRRVKYLRFATSAEAIRHAVEALDAAGLAAVAIDTDDGRLSAFEIKALYDSDAFPLPRVQ